MYSFKSLLELKLRRSSRLSLRLCRDQNYYNIDNVKSMMTQSIIRSALATTYVLASANIARSVEVMSKSYSILVKNETYTEEVNEEVIKGKNDKRIYKAFTLPNGIRTLLISDPSSVSSAAALDVHVGSFSDPQDIPGLAHFCEHMVL